MRPTTSSTSPSTRCSAVVRRAHCVRRSWQLQHRMERNLRRVPAVDHQLINSLVAEADPKALGGTSWADVLATKLGISKGEAKKRIKQAETARAAAGVDG